MTGHDLLDRADMRRWCVLHADRLRLGAAMKIAVAAILAYGSLNAILRDWASPAVAGALAVVTLAIFVVTVRIDLADRLGIPAYLGVQTALVTISMVLGHGIVTLHYTPVIAQAALVCRRRVLVALCAAFGAQSFALGQYFQRDLANSAIELVGFAALTGFIVAFAEAIAAERRARESVEQLATIQERNRLAREVHDSLGHYLTVVHLQLQIAARSLGSDVDAASAAVLRAKQLTHEGLEDVRRSVAALRAPTAEDRPLPDAIATLVARLDATGTAATFALRGDPRALPPVVALTLFRTAQETLTNAEKHAAAAHVAVELAYHADTVELVVRDDGRGDAGDPAGRPRGFGLLGVRERVALVGGSVDVATRPGEGFRVRVVLPAAA
jgi:signal transduction histidine kinase